MKISFKNIILFASFLLTFSACKNNEEEVGKTNRTGKEMPVVTTKTAINQAALVGTYVGLLPCESCDGIKTSIILNDNNSFSTVAEPINDTVFSMPVVDSGKFIIRDSVLELTDMGGIVRNYKITTNKLIQLDDDGKPLDGKGKLKYELEKETGLNP
ncbi:MAG TPA: copper resistance protein NlpE [Edaphocola sp.]|nr:copper resistance protein NlpE [Edaphocola sp.]